jgi:hypothetical protein
MNKNSAIIPTTALETYVGGHFKNREYREKARINTSFIDPWQVDRRSYHIRSIFGPSLLP